MELLEIEVIDFELITLTAVFEGFFLEGFTVEVEFDYHEWEDPEDLASGLKQHVTPSNIYFTEFKTLKEDGQVFSINNRELKKAKQLVEFKLIDLLTEELND